jgi:NCS2 family nucleobase:cation symporter-2
MGATVFVIMPGAVVGAVLVFASCLIFINGITIITSRMLDARRTFVIGLSFMLGLAVDVLPGVFAGLPPALRLFSGSALLFGTFSALVLNVVFRLGVKRTVTLAVDPGKVDPDKIEQFLRAQGGTWGARPDVIARAVFAANQLVEAVTENVWKSGPLALQASFDEFNLDLRLSYEGDLLEFPDRRPSDEEIRETDEGMRRLAGFMLRHNADRIRSEAQGGTATVHFHFDH